MEPIRSREPGRFRRRSTSGSQADVHNETFRVRMDSVENAERPDDVAEASATEILAGLPGVDAPTERLFDAVHQTGQRLLDDRTYTAAQKYREAVRRFLGKILASANAVEVHESQQDILSRKRYYLVTEINRSVDRLLNGLVQTQLEQMEILSRLEEIEGMLVDLLH